MAGARFDGSAGMDVPKANGHITTSSTEYISVWTETDMQDRFCVAGNRISAPSHRIHSVYRQRLVLYDRNRFATFPLRLTNSR